MHSSRVRNDIVEEFNIDVDSVTDTGAGIDSIGIIDCT